MKSDIKNSLKTVALQKKYGERLAVKGVDISVESGSVIGLLGPNGAGKTTTFYMIVGLIPADDGKIYLNSEDITSLPMYKRARRGISYLTQEASIFRGLTVEENLMAILEVVEADKELRHHKKNSLLEEFGISHIATTKGYALSGGERRRVEIARALINNPSFILLDEPFAGIDPIAVSDIQNLIISLKKKNIGIVISDHNVRETLGVCDKGYILSDGLIVESGTAEEIIASDKAKEVYLGEDFRL